MVQARVGIRLATEGGAEVKSEFAAVAAAGTGAMEQIAKSADAVVEASDRAATRTEARWARMAAAAKVAAAAGDTRTTIDAAMSERGNGSQFASVNLDRSSGAARASAGVFEEAAQAEALVTRGREQAAAAAMKLKAALDPLWSAEQRLAREMDEVATAQKAGVLSADELAAAQARAQAQFDRTAASVRLAATTSMGDDAGEHVRAYQQAAAEQERSTAAALKLKAAIDPLWAAEQQLARELEQVTVAQRAGILSSDELAEAQGRAQAQYERTRQAIADSTSGVRMGNDADAQVQTYLRALATEQDQARAAAVRLRGELDPLWAAEQRLESQLREVALAEKAGILSADQLAAAQARSRKEFEQTSDAIRRQGTASAELTTMQRQTLMYTASDIFASSASGTSPLQIAMQQGPQVLQAFAIEEGGMEKLKALLFGSDGISAGFDEVTRAADRAGDGVDRASEESGGALDGLRDRAREAAESLIEEDGVAGGLTKVRGLLNPVSIGIGATAIVIALATKAWLDYANAVYKFEAISQGSGRVIGATGTELEAIAESAAAAARISTSAAREIETGYVQMGGIGKEMLGRLTGITNDFAAATGQDAKGAVQQLGAAFVDPAAGAEDLAVRYGMLDQATIAYIQDLVQQGDMLGAQKVLFDRVSAATVNAADNLNVLARGWQNVKTWADSAWTAMGRALDRLRDSREDRIAQLEGLKTAAAKPGFGSHFSAAEETELQDLKYQQRQDAARAAEARAVSAQQQAASIVETYTGGGALSAYRAAAGKLSTALKTDMPPDQRAQMTNALSAYTHAIDTWIPAQEKANKLASIDAQIAAAKTPAAKAALASQRAQVEAAGQVVTAADAESRAQSSAARARAQGSNAGAAHAASLARQASAMEVSASSALDVADAYLKSAAAGAEAEARRKALTDATRKGIDIDAQVRRQLNLQVAEGAAAGAKSVAQLRAETLARKAVNDNVSAGTLEAARMTQTLGDEAALRPLLSLQAIAQGDAYDRLTKIIEAYRGALKDAHAEEARSAAKAAIASDDERIISLRDQQEFAGDRSGRGAIEIARRAAEREAQDKNWTGQEGDNFVNNRVSLARTEQEAQRTQYLSDQRNAQADALAMTAREIDLVGASEQKREAILEHLRAELDLRSRGIDLASDEAKAILAGVDAQSAANAKLAAVNASMDELRGFALETLDPSGWESWGDAGKSVLNSLKAEFIKLALLNPLKNLLNGNKAAPTISSVIGSVSKLFSPGRNAAGTEYWSGGMTWVGENGAELVDLPTGSRVTPAGETRRMLTAANNGGGGGTSFRFDLRGALVTQDLLDQMNAIGAGAATRGAAGGAAMSAVEGRASAARRLGRRW